MPRDRNTALRHKQAQVLGRKRELTGKRAKVTYSDWRPGDQKVYVSNVSKAKTLLNWEPKKPREGVESLAIWVRDNIGLFLA